MLLFPNEQHFWSDDVTTAVPAIIMELRVASFVIKSDNEMKPLRGVGDDSWVSIQLATDLPHPPSPDGAKLYESIYPKVDVPLPHVNTSS